MPRCSICVLALLLVNGWTAAAPPVPEENAALWYWQAVPFLHDLEIDELDAYLQRVRGEGDAEPLPASERETIEEMSDLVQRASDKPYCRFGLDIEDGPNARSPHLFALLRVFRILAADAEMRLEHGETDAPLHRCLAILRASDHFAEPPNSDQLLASITRHIGIGLAEAVADASPDAEARAQLIETLRATDPGLRRFGDQLDLERRLWIENYLSRIESKEELIEQLQRMLAPARDILGDRTGPLESFLVPERLPQEVERTDAVYASLIAACRANDRAKLKALLDEVDRLEHGILAGWLVTVNKGKLFRMEESEARSRDLIERLQPPAPSPE